MLNSTIFISYAKADRKWLPPLRAHLNSLLRRNNKILIWDDQKIKTGDYWLEEIQKAIQKARVAIFLVSSDFLSSHFCQEIEVPAFLEKRKKDGLLIIPILVRPCPWQDITWLSEIQMTPRDGKCIALDFNDSYEIVFSEIASIVYNFLNEQDNTLGKNCIVDTTRLPVYRSKIYGREDELQLLDEIWNNQKYKVVSFIADGGTGKTVLVAEWISNIIHSKKRQPQIIFAWSFYSQGTISQVTSSDEFIDKALRWFGDPNPEFGSIWDKAERIVELAGQKDSILILDGIEPLQSALSVERGKIKDAVLALILSQLATRNKGLCLITSRLYLYDLKEYSQTSIEINLEQISDKAGRDILRSFCVKGTDMELDIACSKLDKHALAINLLGGYLRSIPGHSISNFFDLLKTYPFSKNYTGAKRLLQSLDYSIHSDYLNELIKLLGFFDRPTSIDQLDILRSSPIVDGLNSSLKSLSERNFILVIQKSRNLQIIYPESKYDLNKIDCHPVIREYFREVLINKFNKAWLEGNKRLFDYLKSNSEHLPSNLEEMTPLYMAVKYGCESGQIWQAFYDIYYERIRRGEDAYSTAIIGAYGTDLGALSYFFDEPWDIIKPEIPDIWKPLVFNWVGFRLRALGHLKEAISPTLKALNGFVLMKNYLESSMNSGNLSEIYVNIGNLDEALVYAKKSIYFADQTNDNHWKASSRAYYGNVLHQLGKFNDSKKVFLEAEQFESNFKYLYGLSGFQFWELLIDLGKFDDAKQRAENVFQWIIETHRGIFMLALAKLTIYKAHLKAHQFNQKVKLKNLLSEINEVVGILRNAGQQDYVPLALLSRSKLFRLMKKFDKAKLDIDEIFFIALRSNLKLILIDTYMELSYYYLDTGQIDKAHESYNITFTRSLELKYNRRKDEIQALGANIGKSFKIS